MSNFEESVGIFTKQHLAWITHESCNVLMLNEGVDYWSPVAYVRKLTNPYTGDTQYAGNTLSSAGIASRWFSSTDVASAMTGAEKFVLSCLNEQPSIDI